MKLRALLVFAGLCSFGCQTSAGHSIVGSWQDKARPYSVSEYKADGTYAHTLSRNGVAFASQSGTWKLDGDALEITVDQSTNSKGMTKQVSPPVSNTYRISWISNDEYSFTSDGQVVQDVRVK